ncbi:MAG: hypothetical protein JO154_13060 [Chitinophaga sp.]|uniref:hypothetical protein n=1 Tax=Chitinophaga sp. TaxID=1869181 RepID=UPI0025C5283D|nr:hypothetical protein [Chitinophaga sp.]MBV8253529.1 hypothetical protein [Chitinophaga sp.]
MYKLILKLTVAIAVLAIFSWFSSKSPDAPKYDEKLMTHVQFTGTITYIETSHNHNFSIFGIKLDSSNTPHYFDTSEVAIAPYSIKDSNAEFYREMPYHATIGVKVVLDADKKKIWFYDNDKLLGSADIRYNHSPTNIKFVREHSRLK